MWRAILKIGRLLFTIIVTVISVLLSVAITLLIDKAMHRPLPLSGLIVAISAPLVLAPLCTWVTTGLLFKIHRMQDEIAVLYIDIDHFKMINDAYGHAEGDIVLRAVASEIGGQIRKSDILGRYGGEEFLITMLNVGEEAAIAAAEKKGRSWKKRLSRSAIIRFPRRSASAFPFRASGRMYRSATLSKKPIRRCMTRRTAGGIARLSIPPTPR